MVYVFALADLNLRININILMVYFPKRCNILIKVANLFKIRLVWVQGLFLIMVRDVNLFGEFEI